jgi:hypothetical protein
VLKVTGATNPAVDVGLGFAMMLIRLAAVVGIGLGVAGALDKKSHKTFPVVGLVINIGIIVISAILVFVGIQMES